LIEHYDARGEPVAIYFKQKLQRLFLSVNVLKTYMMQSMSKPIHPINLEESQTFQNSPFSLSETQLADSYDEQVLKSKRIKTLCGLKSNR
jgi:hypothetical protein